MKILDVIKNKRMLINMGLLALGIVIGWILFGGSGSGSVESMQDNHSLTDHEQGAQWTCSMHPQIRETEPGTCPICGMELVPVESDEEDDDGSEYTIKLSNAAMKIAEVETSLIEKKAPFKEVYLPGKVMPDERNISELTSRFPGRIEKLLVNFTGQKVRKGQVLAKIYSPELVTAQRELFEAMKFRETNPSYYRAARNKLKLWDIAEDQILRIENSGEVNFYFDVLSPITGTVTMRHVAIGDYVKEGSALFEVVDLRHVWVMFDAYESDIPWIKLGDKIKFKIKSIPGEEFESVVTFIDPVLDHNSRVAGIRAELDNQRDMLKPQMLASGILKTMLPGSGDQLVIPKSAVLWTGKRAVVYVMTEDHENMFQYREIEMGAEASDYYVVKAGLMEGELVASNGVFKIDAAAQLKGEQSMMNPEGGKVTMAHDHGSMETETPTNTDASEGQLQKAPEKNIQMKMAVDENFQLQLTNVYLSQLDLQKAFLASDANSAKEALPVLVKSIQEVDMSLVEGEMHNHWMASLQKLNSAIERIKSSEDVEEQRSAYSDFNNALYEAIKMFGSKGEVIYYQFCPMANNNEGAFWLTNNKEIENPYYGDAMLTCGETKEVIK